jgi:hypothetical protein
MDDRYETLLAIYRNACVGLRMIRGLSRRSARLESCRQARRSSRSMALSRCTRHKPSQRAGEQSRAPVNKAAPRLRASDTEAPFRPGPQRQDPQYPFGGLQDLHAEKGGSIDVERCWISEASR